MAQKYVDSYGARQALKIGAESYDIFRLDALEKAGFNNVSKLPVSLKVLLENLLRQEDNHHVNKADIEALAEIDSAEARKAIEAALKDPDPQVRREAANHAGDKVSPADRETFLLKALKSCSAFDGLTEALDEAEEFHPPSVIDALVRGALNRDGETAVHFAAMLFFLHGKAKEQFDWDHRPFFLRFNTTNREERKAAFRELCETIGVEAEKYLR